MEVVALSSEVCYQAKGAQPSSATTAIAVLWKKRSGAFTFLGPTTAFMRHLGLAGRADLARRKTAAGDSFADLMAESHLRCFRLAGERRDFHVAPERLCCVFLLLAPVYMAVAERRR